MPNIEEILTILPHQPPFRFIDHVIEYAPGRYLQASFTPDSAEKLFSVFIEVPETIMIEGLAQAAVLLTQLETEPLKEGDIPLLGSVKATLFESVPWDKTLIYTVEPIRILEKQAVIQGNICVDGQTVLKATLSVAVSTNLL